ncbi:MAG: hypothetical protein COB02_15730 [Candidatus Cloacimonadota bacterium]|nr:MAG: hypothetical protein COB02_15730 [Candidatus Cloacimonadota bacterium]
MNIKLLLASITIISSLFSQKTNLKQINNNELYSKSLHCELGELKASFTASKSFDKYEAEYLSYVSQLSPKFISENSFLDDLKQADVIVMADNHVSYGSQSNSVEIIKKLAKNSNGLNLVIEWIDTSFQAVVNQYLRDQLSLNELKEKIQFDKLWAFSWDSYKRVLQTAKENKVAVYLVENLKNTKNLVVRDQHIFDSVLKIQSLNKSKKILIIYGTYHSLGLNHLFERFKKNKQKTVSIVSQAENAYWIALKTSLDSDRLHQLQLSKDIYYLHDSAPQDQLYDERMYYLNLLDMDEDEYLCE